MVAMVAVLATTKVESEFNSMMTRTRCRDRRAHQLDVCSYYIMTFFCERSTTSIVYYLRGISNDRYSIDTCMISVVNTLQTMS